MREDLAVLQRPPEAVIEERDVDFSIYEVPVDLIKAGLDRQILDGCSSNRAGTDLRSTTGTQNARHASSNPKGEVEIAVAGKYIELHDAYKSIYESLHHAGISHAHTVKLRKVAAESLGDDASEALAGVDGILVPGGFGERGFEGKIAAIRYARENNIPFFGICYGMQAATVEYARNVAGIEGRDDERVLPRRETPGDQPDGAAEGDPRARRHDAARRVRLPASAGLAQP